jgi:hypothetical protein
VILAVIVACEIGFWALLSAGLAARYLLRRRRLATALLLSVPLVDVVLLTATVLDLRNGGTASFTHGLAAIYLGVSVAFGPRMVRWADERFAHRFAGGPPPRRPARGGPEHARAARQGWYRHLLAWAIGSGLILLAVALVGDADRTTAMTDVIWRWAIVLGVDLLWSFSYTLWPRRPDKALPGSR